MHICKYCQSKRKNKNSLTNHERYCKENPNRAISYFESHKEELAKIHSQRVPSNQYTKAKRLGLPIPEVSIETRAIHAKNSKAHADRYWSIEENHIKHSIAMKKAVADHPDSYSKYNVCGRVKHINYNGHIFKGTWEVIAAKWLDKQNISWTSEEHILEYQWQDSTHTYFPDFFVSSLDMYIEVKGFKRDRDIAKWNSVNKHLIILDKCVIHKLNGYTMQDIIGICTYKKDYIK